MSGHRPQAKGGTPLERCWGCGRQVRADKLRTYTDERTGTRPRLCKRCGEYHQRAYGMRRA